MIDETLNPSLNEKSTASDSVENQEISKKTINSESEALMEKQVVVDNSEVRDTINSENTVSEPVVENNKPAPSSENAKPHEKKLSTQIQGAVVSEMEMKNLSSCSLKDIVLIFQKLVDKGDIMEVNKYADYIKATFYKVLKEKKIASGFTATPLSEAEIASIENKTPNIEISVNPFAEIERAFKAVYAQYKQVRAEYFKKLEIEKEENLKIREGIINELKALLEATEDINKTFPAFRALQARWREAGSVPQAEVKNIYETYQHNVERFYDVVKINKEFRDLDFRKNLEAKTELCEKAEALINEDNIINAFMKLQKLHEEWKELGPVAKEFREKIWDRFKAATSKINKMHQEYFVNLKAKQRENLAAKTALCEKAEEISDREINESNGWNNSSKELENLQKEWRTIGYASKKDNQRIYDRFRAACDKFYGRKREYYASFKEQMNRNLEKKVALCEQAEAVMDSTDWKNTTDKLIDLQKQWKGIGPVSRKKSDQIWNRFRAACDKFFNNKEKNFGGVDPKYVENLRLKLSLIEEIKSYEDRDERAAKEFAERWNAIGFVPIKEKDSLAESYKSAMQDKFPNFKLILGHHQGGVGRSEKHQDNSVAHNERERLIQKFRKLESEIATYENNLGFFANSKKADSLIKEVNKKIESAKAELAALEVKIRNIENKTE